MTDNIPDYSYRDSDPTWANAYLWPVIQNIIREEKILRDGSSDVPRAFDLGCGNGATVNMLSHLGFDGVGIDPSESGIMHAREAFPHCQFELASAYDELSGKFGTFPLVVSLEVIEHCYKPHAFMDTFNSLIQPGGVGIISTPYHGYLKNIALALTNKWDNHLSPLWEGGHIKFFSIKTLGQLLEEAGFEDIRFLRVGRIPMFAKSMIAVVRKS